MADIKNKKTRVGVVSSVSMDKSMTVTIQRKLRHPIYGKFVKKSKKFMAHDEKNECLSLIHISEPTRPY